MPGVGERYLDIHAVAAKIGRTTKTVRRKVKDKSFPPPFRWSGSLMWLESDVDRWMIRNALENEIRPDEIDAPLDNLGHSGTSHPPGQEGTGKAEKRR